MKKKEILIKLHVVDHSDEDFPAEDEILGEVCQIFTEWEVEVVIGKVTITEVPTDGSTSDDER